MSLGDSPFDISSIVFNAMQSNDGFSRDPNTGANNSQAQKGFWQRLSGVWGSITTLASHDSEDELELLELLP